MFRFISYSVILFLCFLSYSCSSTVGICHIHGKAPNPNLEGGYIYLIAFDKSIRDSVGVDSAMIKEGKFEIETSKNMIGILRMDYHHRYNTEELLVVEEPGDVYVNIDSISYGSGTKHNDILQKWKDVTILSGQKRSPLFKQSYAARHAGKPEIENLLRSKADSIFVDYMKQTKSLADECDEGPLKDFLLGRIPDTFQYHNTDGTTKDIKLR